MPMPPNAVVFYMEIVLFQLAYKLKFYFMPDLLAPILLLWISTLVVSLRRVLIREIFVYFIRRFDWPTNQHPLENPTQRNMTVKEKRDENLSKEGCCRVAFYYLTGSPHIYTLECNYNVGKFMNSIASGRSGAVTPPLATMPNQKYTPNSYAEVGRGLLAASLDIFDSNPLPRVAPNQVKALR